MQYIEKKLVRKRLSELRPAEYNPRKSLTPEDPEYWEIRRSIEELGYLDPIIINDDNTIISGHQRRTVLMDMGETEAEVIQVSLDKARERALNVALNKIDGVWDQESLAELLREIDLSGLDATLTGFSEDEIDQLQEALSDPDSWFDSRKKNDTDRQEGNEEYNAFLDKFEPKKTTDDCYTPDNVYDAVAAYVEETYQVARGGYIRPFYPGGDYQNHRYPDGCVVVDNPPFSILSQIVGFYVEHGIRFFLFAPALTIMSGGNKCCAICVGASVTYENGATVGTSFLTNLEEKGARTSPRLFRMIDAANKENLATMRKELPKYEYPDNVITSAKLQYFSKYGIDFRVTSPEMSFIRELDAQSKSGKAIYGGGFLISRRKAAEKAAAEKAAAEKAAAEKWQLSEREWQIVDEISRTG